MKRSIVLMLGLILATISSANITNHFNEFGCREGLEKFDETLSLTAQVEQDLLHGFWIQGSPDASQTMIQFAEGGKAVFLKAAGSGSVYEASHYSWEVVVLNSEPILLLQNQQTQEIRQRLVEQTCLGINLVDPDTGEKESYDYRPVHLRQQEQQETALTGRWENVLASVTLADNCAREENSQIEMKKVSFQFVFREDGTFTRVLNSPDAQLRFEEEGRWEISKDGKKLFLHCTDAMGNTITQCAKIKYLQMDELVLEHPLSIVGKRFASVKNEDFFFNKQ